MLDLNIWLTVLCLSILLDLADGEVRERVCPLHPVVVTWRLGNYVLSRIGMSFISGIVLLVTVTCTILALYVLAPQLIVHVVSLTLNAYSELAAICIFTLLLKFTFSIRLLFWYVYTYIDLWEKGKRGNARVLLQEIVRRDVFALSDEQCHSAIIETLVESIVDGIASPLFYYMLFDLYGAYIQRVVNTLDSLVGYPYEPFKNVGKAVAYIDTLLNYVPARLVGIIILATRLRIGTFKTFLKVLKRSNVSSRNARFVFAAIATILQVRLEKPGEYTVAEWWRLPNLEDVKRCVKLCSIVIFVYLCVLMFLRVVLVEFLHCLHLLL